MLLARRPILTQACMSGVLFGLGDVCAQQLVERRGIKGYEWQRTARLALYGTLIAGPVVAHWYRWMDRNIRHTNVGLQTIIRVAADQSIVAPSFLTAFFFFNSLSSGQSLEQAKNTWSERFLPTLIDNYKVWPFVNFANFYIVPLQHRLLVVNTVALVWNTYLAYIANKVDF